MAIFTPEYGYVSYECSDLIREVHEDIDIFGKHTMVYAVYKYLPKYKINVIIDYMVCEQPDDEPAVKQNVLGRSNVSLQEEREQIRKFKATIEPNEKMITLTLEELLQALNIQNEIM